MPFFVELAVIGLTLLILYVILGVKSSPRGLDEFVSRRAKEERPNIEKDRQAAQKVKADIEEAMKRIKK